MAEYAVHANRARELMEKVEQAAKGRLSQDQCIKMAQVEALLALAAALRERRSAAESG
ncbi:hypothetical protein AB0I00_40165 [Streptomyces sp. NPDC050803]|uniref:hypothetical protein n=1 Tax=unclassified Streptomyces TaxID=2593676 RepID=UPI003440F6DD